ncbi:hypothetical protein VTK73DRAFT_3218 [Phialemonium thermophilum]|uniref:Uncharacterized protein n=1 Tax=Phialemonium thermophilum TaxID=223376 RepID=A0ABR3VJH4_9PEZI
MRSGAGMRFGDRLASWRRRLTTLGSCFSSFLRLLRPPPDFPAAWPPFLPATALAASVDEVEKARGEWTDSGARIVLLCHADRADGHSGRRTDRGLVLNDRETNREARPRRLKNEAMMGVEENSRRLANVTWGGTLYQGQGAARLADRTPILLGSCPPHHQLTSRAGLMHRLGGDKSRTVKARRLLAL